jgi:hypothetical protein
MTVHLVSVGLSIRDALKDPETRRRKLKDKHELIAAIGRAEPWNLLVREAGVSDPPRDRDRELANQWLAEAVGGTDNAKAARLGEVAAAIRPREWPLDMSAELETFALAAGMGKFSLAKGDIAVFICSDTPPGLAAGVWNALGLTAGDLSRVRYAGEPGSLPGDLGGHAVLVRITGMDASSSEGFGRAMDGLGLLARQLFVKGKLHRAEEFRFYLSGGYKAAIPYLIGLAEAVHSVDKQCLSDIGVPDLMPKDGQPYPVTAWVLHDTAGTRATGGRPVPPIRLPLRRLIAESVREELTEYDNTTRRRTGKPVTPLLEGYAYEVARDGRTSELTPFGMGLRALFGMTPEGTLG